ncbi:MAG: MCE family protein [Blastocatellia bacterium]|nr:MCE family protein [Blastocatellia bacterium]
MPQPQKSSLAGLRVGLLVLAAIGILILTIFAVSGDITLFRQKTTVRTFMSNVDGLHKGAEVRLSGVKIGSVKEINFNPQIPADEKAPDLIEIKMEINGKINGVDAVQRIRSDSIAVLKGAGVLGDNIIDISPGTTKGQPIQNNAIVKSYANKSVGDIINASKTAMDNLNVITDNIKDVTADIKNGEGSIGRFLKDDAIYSNLNKTVLQSQALLESIRKGEGTAGKLISDPALYNQASELVTSFKETSEQVKVALADVQAGKGTVGKLLKDEELYNRAKSLIAKFETTADKLDATIAKVNRGEGTVGKLLYEDKLYEEFRDSLSRIRTLTDGLEKGQGTAGKLLKDEALYRNLNETTTEMTKLLYDLRQNPKKYLDIKVRVF